MKFQFLLPAILGVGALERNQHSKVSIGAKATS